MAYDIVPAEVKERAQALLYELPDAFDKSIDLDENPDGSVTGTNIYKMLLLAAVSSEKTHLLQVNMQDWRSFENAEGATLDIFGQWLSLPRGSMTDAEYIAMMKLNRRIDANAATFESLYDAVEYLFGIDRQYIVMDEIFPAKIRIELDSSYVTVDSPIDTAIAAKMIDDVVAAGVGYKIYMLTKKNLDFYLGGATGVYAKISLGVAPAANENIYGDLYVGAHTQIDGDVTVQGE